MKRIKKLIPNSIKIAFKSALNPSLKKQQQENARIQGLERYTPTTTTFLNKNLRITDNASFLFLKQELFEAQVYKFSCDSPEPFIIDCGANVGLSIIYFKEIFPNASIIAFEPDEKVFDVLKFNIDSFKLENVNLFQKACWSETTTLEFFSEGADGGRQAMKGDAIKRIEKVETIRLKDYLIRKVDFLKIDIEGAELEVLKDAKENLNLVEKIFVEYHSFIGQEQCLPELLAILKDVGFRLHITAPGLTSIHPLVELNTYAGMDNQINIFGFREK